MEIVINHAYKDGMDLNRSPMPIQPSNMVRIEDQNKENLAHNDYNHSFCPAFKYWHRNKWKVILNKDLKIKINKIDKTIETNISVDEDGKIIDMPWKSPPAPSKHQVNKTKFPWKNSKFSPSPGTTTGDPEKGLTTNWPKNSLGFMMDFSDETKIEVQCFFCNLFWTESKDVWLSLLHDPFLSKHNIELIPGTFPISVWPRLVIFTFKIIDTNIEEIFLPKDTVLFHLNFHSRYQDPIFKIKSKIPDVKIQKILVDQSKFKIKYKGYAWKLITERLKKDKPSKCPFLNFLK